MFATTRNPTTLFLHLGPAQRIGIGQCSASSRWSLLFASFGPPKRSARTQSCWRNSPQTTAIGRIRKRSCGLPTQRKYAPTTRPSLDASSHRSITPAWRSAAKKRLQFTIVIRERGSPSRATTSTLLTITTRTRHCEGSIMPRHAENHPQSRH